MNCFVSINSKNKAKRDIDHLMLEMGYKDLAVKGIGHGHVETFVRKSLSMVSLLLRLKKGDVLVIQYPFKKFYSLQCRIAHLRGAKTITLIHDLGSFRRRKLTVEQEMHRLAHTDYIIAHNPKMKDWILEQATAFLPQRDGKNFFEHKIVCLEIFDYLSKVEPHLHNSTGGQNNSADKPNNNAGGHNRIVYAGGLGERKNAFLYTAGRAVEPLSIDVCGSGNLDTHRFAPNIHYHGRIASDEFIRGSARRLPANKSDDADRETDGFGDWGLVWDGDSTEGCSGIWGEYLKYNNPHKASFYIRAGLPVIVWKQAAMAPFVETEGVGITIDSLKELPLRLRQVTGQQYAQICGRVFRMAQRLQQGYYFRRAIREILAPSNGRV